MSRRPNDKNQAILKALLKEQGNNSCADCKSASHPRWASWNLGIFICIRCSGIHRSMGTHISRVKSVDLDTWTDEQVASMVKWGNYKANQYWESKLPGGKHTPDDSKIENFIRTKYDLKKWATSPNIPNPSTLGKPLSINTSSNAPSTSSTPSNNNQENRRSLNSNLLDLEFGSPIAAPSASQSPPIINSHSAQFSKLTPSSNDPPQHQSPSAQLQQQQQWQHQQQQNQRDNTRPELKKSILSLYSTPLSATNSTPNFPVHQQQQNLSTSSFNSNNSNANSLNGLNFSSSTPAFNQTTASNQWNNTTSSPSNNNNNWNNTQASNPWSNVQSQTSSNTNSFNNSNQGFEDPFKNVWK